MRQQHFVPFLIRVGNKSENEGYIDPTIPLSIRVMMLKSAWQKLHESGCHITAKTVEYIARKYRITNGKWLFFSSGGAKIDYLWKLVCKGMKSGTIKATGAKVSPYDPDADDFKHVVCIYNYDFTNKEEVASLEKQIREAGLKCHLFYKPDAYTYLGIYRDNEWGLKPSIHIGDYHILLKQSVIEW